MAPSASVRVTARPTPTPGPQIATAIDALQAANSARAQLLTVLNSALTSFDTASIETAGRALSDFGIAELRRMGDLDVPDCLAGVFVAWSQVLISSSGAGTLFEVGASRGDAEAISLGGEQLNKANAAAEVVVQELRVAQLRC